MPRPAVRSRPRSRRPAARRLSHTLLGGALRRANSVSHFMGFMDFATAERERRRWVEEAFVTVKIKVASMPIADVEMVRRIRETCGPNIDTCIGCQSRIRKRPARRLGLPPHRGLQDQNISSSRSKRIGSAWRRSPAPSDAPVMADESAWNATTSIEIIERRAAQMVSIYTTKPGGLYRAMQVAAVCKASGIVCNVNGSIETRYRQSRKRALGRGRRTGDSACVFPVSTPPRHNMTGSPASITWTTHRSSR